MATPSKGGVFDRGTDRRVEKFTESISVDHRLYAHDIAGSIAHAQMLAEVGLLTAEECGQIEDALAQIRADFEEQRLELRADLEDVHMHVERALIDRLGDVGRKLHTGRSRNDQVATDLRLWIRNEIDKIDIAVRDLQRAFVERCDADFDVILPGYTHLRHAQPVLASHYWLAYCEKLDRDRARLVDARRRVNVSGLGTAALAGTSLPLDREDVAGRLGFDGVAANSLDVASDRDFVLETTFALAVIALHLSGWAEEWILWSTDEFGFLSLPIEFCTGSSIMPQKINPDVLELIRGRSGRVVGNLVNLMVVVKGLPLAYNRDLQEDKPPLFDSVDTVKGCLRLAAPIVAGARLNRDAIARHLETGHLDATTFMEYLIGRGMPQRTAHHRVGQLVRKALDRGVPLSKLSLGDFQEVDPDLDEGVYQVLGARKAIESFASYGSTAPKEVRAQIERWKKRLESN